MRHNLKCWPDAFQAARQGTKTAEFRRDDRNFSVGDELTLREWDPTYGQYTGEFAHVLVVHIVRGPAFEIPEGFVMMSVVTCDY